MLILIVAAGSLMTVTVVGIAVGVCHCKKRRSGKKLLNVGLHMLVIFLTDIYISVCMCNNN